jgi:type IV pilus biogenesis protein CpaD/CtpE
VKLLDQLTEAGSKCVKRQGKLVYDANRTKDGIYNLYHDKITEEIVSFGGYSASDRDALNTFLDEMDHDPSVCFKLSQGELQLTTNHVAGSVSNA